MEAPLHPKFLNQFNTDYNYDELTEEQKEVHDALFAPDEVILVGEEGLEEGEVELDQIIEKAKGGEAIVIPDLLPEDKSKREKIVQKEKDREDAIKSQSVSTNNSNIGSKPKKSKHTAEEDLIHKIIGKKVRFEEIDEKQSGEEEESDEDEPSIDDDEPDILPGQMPSKPKKELVFSASDFPPLSSVNDKDSDILGMDGEYDVDMLDDEDGEEEADEDEMLGDEIHKEQQLENKFRDVLKKEYNAATIPTGAKGEKQLSAAEFNLIMDQHLAGIEKKKMNMTEIPPAQKPKYEPIVESVIAKGGGTITFYFGGAKPESGRAKKLIDDGLIKSGVKKPEEDEGASSRPPADPRKTLPPDIAKLAQAIKKHLPPKDALKKVRKVSEAEIEEDGEGDWEDDGEEEEGEWEEIMDVEEVQDGEEEELGSQDEVGTDSEEGLDAEEKFEKFLEKMQLHENLPLCMRIARDEKLPDTLLGLKVFKRTLLPDIPFKEDVALQRALYDEEEEIDYSKPPEIFDSKSIREPIIEYERRPNVATKKEALGKATVVKEYRTDKKRKDKKVVFEKPKDKAEHSKSDKKPQDNEDEEDGGSSDDVAQSVAQDPQLVRQRGETVDERKARKDLIKKQKEERKDKKKKFKEKYENLKKGLLNQNNAQTQAGGQQGVGVYRLG